MDKEPSSKTNLYSPTKRLKIICATVLVCSLSFFYVCILPFAGSWIEQCATAANRGDRVVPDADKVDFGKSVMLGPSQKVREGDILNYQIILRNTGSQQPEYIELRSRIDATSAMLASAPELSYDLENRDLRWRGTVGPGEERRLTVKLITLPESAGTWVFTRASINWGSGNKDFVISTEIHSELRPSRFILPGGFGIGWAEVIILAYLFFAVLFMIIVPRVIRSREAQPFKTSRVSPKEDDFGTKMTKVMSFAFVVAVGFVLFCVGIVFEDIRMFASYEKATCTILDKYIKQVSGSGTSSRSYLDPMVAVQFMKGREEIFAASSIGRGSFLSTGDKSATNKLNRYEFGKSYPCWFDPEHPRTVVLNRSLSWSSYLIGVALLLLILISFRYLFSKLRGPGASSQISNGPIQ